MHAGVSHLSDGKLNMQSMNTVSEDERHVQVVPCARAVLLSRIMQTAMNASRRILTETVFMAGTTARP
jgi:hypothetical protein